LAVAIVGGVGLGLALNSSGHGKATSVRNVTATSAAAPDSTSSSIQLPPSTKAVPSTTRTTAAPAAPKPPSGGLAGKVVVIDPGHNGANGTHTTEINRPVNAGGFMKACDTTGTATNAGYTEAAYNFDVSQRVAAILRQAGATVTLTRNSNDGWGPCIDQRAAVGNQAHADAAISIHADGGPSTGRGFHVIQPATGSIVAASHILALAVRAHYLAGTGMPYADYVAQNGLDTRSDLGGLNLSTVPKVFIETGNMRNATDAAMLTSASYRQTAAQALAAGLIAYLTGAP
jgi:N-acetylmuramoyl-L-alanine amidase